MKKDDFFISDGFASSKLTVKKDVPDTSDNTNLYLWLIMMAAASGCLYITKSFRKRHQ
ncbi:MAG: hypothetical protein IJM15_03095 [Erysipelotrichaceae bacterium]|nr:hypothetical protein [Erysipelotrichaceae bacterium]